MFGKLVPALSVIGSSVSTALACAPAASTQLLSSGVAGAGAKPSLIEPVMSRLPPARITSAPGSPDP